MNVVFWPKIPNLLKFGRKNWNFDWKNDVTFCLKYSILFLSMKILRVVQNPFIRICFQLIICHNLKVKCMCVCVLINYLFTFCQWIFHFIHLFDFGWYFIHTKTRWQFFFDQYFSVVTNQQKIKSLFTIVMLWKKWR